MPDTNFAKGLAGVIATESKICTIDGDEGLLSYRGYSIQDLAANSNFAESAYLLLFGNLPSESELADFSAKLEARREIRPEIIDGLRLLPADTHPMVALQQAVAAHGSFDAAPGGEIGPAIERSIDLIARFPTMVAARARLAAGQEPIAPRQDLGHGQNFLYMLSGEVPDTERGDIFDDCLILHMEHSLNASTFTARVVSATLAPVDASVSAAVGALYGRLHGGANERVLHMLTEIESAATAEAWLDDQLAVKRKIMGMGHRVYRAKDPRAHVLEAYLKHLADKAGGSEDYDKLKVIERKMSAIMEAKGKQIYPNVDYFSGSLYRVLDIDVSLFTPIFAIARVVGWCAHILEQWEDNRIYRPRAAYTGEHNRTWAPVSERG